MKKSTLISCFSFLTFSILFFSLAYTQPPPPPGFKWEPVPEITDEFNTWDNAKWFKSLWNYGVPVQMLDKNSGVSDGNLWIQATLDSGAVRWFETSRIYSRARIKFPMYTECRMKTAHISAYNTFWLNNGDINNRDEIDICENNSKPSRSGHASRPYTMYSQYFLTVNGQDERAHGNFDNRNLSSTNPLQGVKWNEDYHILGAWWKDKNNVQFYLDGEPAGSVTTTRDFTRELNVIWDLWTIDAQWSGGIANQSDLLVDSINTMYVDWVHTYSLESDGTMSIGDDRVSFMQVEIFPNPTADVLNIHLLDPVKKDASVQIYNKLGQLLKTEVLQTELTTLSLADLPSGLYVVHIMNNGEVMTRKVIRE